MALAGKGSTLPAAQELCGPVTKRLATPFNTKCTQPNIKASAHRCGESHDGDKAGALSRRTMLTAAIALAAAVAVEPQAALAAEEVVAEASSGTAAAAAPTTVYFGNGCFWGRQHDFVEAERAMGRSPERVSAVVGYAGGRATGNSVYEKLGHAEVVQVELDGTENEVTDQMRMFADKYFSQFRKTPFGMMRLDPQDAGPGYRNVVGIPGGVNSPLFKALQERNVYGMELREGDGNSPTDGKLEDDRFNTVWVLDSNQLGFHRAEKYHQFHDGIGHPFSPEYKVQQREAAEKAGRIGDTGCPEGGFFFGV